MRFAVVVCSRCRRALVVEVRGIQAACRGCGAAFAWHERKPFYQGEDPEEARRVAAQVGLEVGGAGIVAMAESAAALERERAATIDDVVAALAGRPDFGADEVASEASRLKFPWSPDRVVEWLRSQHRVYEPRPGRYRWID